MRNSFGSAVDTAIDSAVRVSSAIADLAGGRRVDLNALIPQLSTVIDTATGMVSWGQRVEKLAIGSLDNSRLTVVAHYNPKEIQIDKQVLWMQHNSSPKPERPRDSQQDDAEINSVPIRSMSVELLFDGFEDHRSIQPEIDKLEVLSSIQEPGSKKEARRRPHHCVVTWGAAGIRPFRCVIESLSTKLTMFAPNGTPLRATCTVKLKEVHVLAKLLEEGGVANEVLRPLLKWKR